MAYQVAQGIEDNQIDHALHIAFELSLKSWKLGFSDGRLRSPRIVSIDAGDFEQLHEEVRKSFYKFGLAAGSPIYSCYEAGREGFWLHRALHAAGIENEVVDSASIEVNRRKRRAKTDRLDAAKLVSQLVRHRSGEPRVWSVVRVPDVDAEDIRQLNREMELLKKERKQHRCRIQSLLFAQGVDLTAGRGFLKALKEARLWDSSKVPPHLLQRLRREYKRFQLVEKQLRDLKDQRKKLLKDSKDVSVEKARRMMQLKGVGLESSWTFGLEFFGWRTFKNRKEVAGAAGLTPTPYASGDVMRDQGISKAGSKRVRHMAIEIAWFWLRFQPDSELSRWYGERFGGGKRMARIGIVALARRLLIALWRFIEQGVIPDGAVLKKA